MNRRGENLFSAARCIKLLCECIVGYLSLYPRFSHFVPNKKDICKENIIDRNYGFCLIKKVILLMEVKKTDLKSLSYELMRNV